METVQEMYKDLFNNVKNQVIDALKCYNGFVDCRHLKLFCYEYSNIIDGVIDGDFIVGIRLIDNKIALFKINEFQLEDDFLTGNKIDIPNKELDNKKNYTFINDNYSYPNFLTLMEMLDILTK